MHADDRDRAGRLIFWTLVVLAILVFASGIAGDFLFGHTGWCAARRAVAGRNFLKFGFLDTHFGPVENYGFVSPDRFEPYWHHPPGMHLLIGLTFRVFGPGEWQTRLMPILVNVLNFVVFYRLSARWFRRPGLVTAGLLFITTPMLSYYGPFVAQETLTLLTMLLTTLLYVQWRESGRWATVGWAALVAFLGGWTDWPWFLFAFMLAVWELGRLARARRLDLRWLLPFGVAVTVGLVGVLAHLITIQGGLADPLAGFLRIFSHRSGGEAESLRDVTIGGGHRWIELFTPGLIMASGVWFVLALVDLVRGRFGLKHAVGLMLLAVGAGWVVIFREGARIHEYWPFYAAPFFVLVGADLVDRAALALQRATGTRRTLTRAGLAILAVVVLTQAATGFAGHIGRHEQLDRDNPHESDGYRFRHSLLGRWLGEHTDPSERVAYQWDIIKSHFQVGWYADRINRGVEVAKEAKRVPAATGYRWVVLDLRTLPVEAAPAVLADAVGRFPVVFLEDFVIIDTQRRGHGAAPSDARDADTPAGSSVTWLRVATHPAGFLHRWFVSRVYDPYEVVADDLLAAQALLATGFEDEAFARYGAVDGFSDSLEHRIANHNLALAMGLTPPDVQTWLPRFMALPPGVDTPPDFGGHVSMLAAEARFDWRYGVSYEAVYRCDAELVRGWRAYIHRLSAEIDTPDQRTVVTPQRVWFFPMPETWRAGQLALLRGHFGLNRLQTGVDVRWGFWRPAMDGEPVRFLQAGGRDYLQAPALNQIPAEPLPWWLGWTDLRWLAEDPAEEATP